VGRVEKVGGIKALSYLRELVISI